MSTGTALSIAVRPSAISVATVSVCIFNVLRNKTTIDKRPIISYSHCYRRLNLVQFIVLAIAM